MIYDEIKNKRQVVPEDAGIKLTYEQLTTIIENLSSKIAMVNQCALKLLDETENYIKTVQHLCFKAVKTLKDKEYYYLNLISLAQDGLPESRMQEIIHQISISTISHIPNLQLNSIYEYYQSDFFTEFQKISDHTDPKKLLTESFSLPIDNYRVSSLAITSDDKYIVSGGKDNTVRIWSILGQSQESVLLGHTNRVICLAITSNNKYVVSGGADGLIIIWHLRKKRQKAMIYSKITMINSVAVSSDNRYIVSGSGNFYSSLSSSSSSSSFYSESSGKDYSLDNSIIIWNFKETTKEAALLGHTKAVMSILITNDNKYIVSGSKDNTVRIWNLQEKVQEAVLDGYFNFVHIVAVTSDCKYIFSASGDGSLRLWNIQGKIEEPSLINSRKSFICNQISHDNKCIFIESPKIKHHPESISSSSSSDSEYGTYEMEVMEPKDDDQDYLLRVQGKEKKLVGIKIDENYFIHSSDAQGLMAWNFREKRTEYWNRGDIDDLGSLESKNDSKYSIQSAESFLRVWDLQDKKLETVLTAHTKFSRYVFSTSDNRYAVTSDKVELIIWDTKERQQIGRWKGFSENQTIAATNDNKYMIICYINEINGLSTATVIKMKIRQDDRS